VVDCGTSINHLIPCVRDRISKEAPHGHNKHQLLALLEEQQQQQQQQAELWTELFIGTTHALHRRGRQVVARPGSGKE
jgi:hypothetical protein